MKLSKLYKRSDFTLVEILVAMGVLAIGMIGICALLPLGIRNVTASVHRSVGASVARSAMVSMHRGSIDLSGSDGRNVRITGPYGAPLWEEGDAGGLQKRITLCTKTIDRRGGFRIPEDMYEINGDTVPYRTDGQPSGYSWSAALIPNLPTDRPVDKNDTDISYTGQVAVWHQYRLLDNQAGVNPEWKVKSDGTAKVTKVSQAFWDLLSPGDRVRDAVHGWWFVIDQVRPAASEIVLAGHVPQELVDSHANNGPAAMDAASQLRLLSLYDFALRPPAE